jgi:hypothetical protein
MAVRPDTKKRFIRRVDRYLDINRKVTETELKRQVQLLRDSRDAVTSDLSRLQPTDFRMSFLPQLRQGIQSRLNQITPLLQQSIQNAQLVMSELTVEKVDELVTSAGIDISLVPSMADTELLKATQTLTGELISTIPQTLTRKVGNTIALGIMQQKSVNEIIDDIRGVYKTTVSEAERIARTEVMRTQSLVQNNRFEQIVEQQPSLLKTWKWSHLPDGRSGHADAEFFYSANPIPFKDPFMVAPISGGSEEALQYPRDPSGSPANTINCACIHLLLPPDRAKELAG